MLRTCLLVWWLILFCSLQKRKENNMKIMKFQLSLLEWPSAYDVWGPREFSEKIFSSWDAWWFSSSWERLNSPLATWWFLCLPVFSRAVLNAAPTDGDLGTLMNKNYWKRFRNLFLLRLFPVIPWGPLLLWRIA